jgi:beta-glucosidase
LNCIPHHATETCLLCCKRLGGCEKIDADQAIAEASELAQKSDVAIFVGGLTPEWESEGFDRPTLDMPGRQNELISCLAKANPQTIVVLQAVRKNSFVILCRPSIDLILRQGSAVSMPWVDDVAGIVQAWYSGNEVGNAIADILYGTVNPSGRLPLTLPVSFDIMGHATVLIHNYPNSIALRTSHHSRIFGASMGGYTIMKMSLWDTSTTRRS